MAIVRQPTEAHLSSEPREDGAHKALVRRAEKWLKRQGWKIVIRDCFKAYVYTGEQPDVIAWRDGVSIVIECKTSRADYLAYKKKFFRVEDCGMGDWRFFFCPDGLVLPGELPSGWGLLYATDKAVKKICGWPGNTQWHNDKPFTGNKFCEVQFLTSVVRRFAVRDMLDVVYLEIGEKTQQPAHAAEKGE